jgi:hypothetical protein
MSKIRSPGELEFEHIVELPAALKRTPKIQWCEENLQGRFSWRHGGLQTVCWLFEHIEDAVLFKLRWASRRI